MGCLIGRRNIGKETFEKELKMKYILLHEGHDQRKYQKIILPKLNHCAICGSPACDRTWNDGIGDICCSNDECRKSYNGCHYSGRYRTKKRDAIRTWNENVEIETLQNSACKKLATEIAKIMFGGDSK